MSATIAPAPHSETVPLRRVAMYSLPTIGYGFCAALISMYLMKYATDVLLIAPAVMGGIFALSRVWDAVSDPLAGYLSDQTRSVHGRRRPWLLIGAVPMGLGFVAMWAPPAGLAGTGLIVWMSAAVFVFFTAYTIVRVPHMALGAEVSLDHHARTRVFGGYALAENVGALIAAGVMFAVTASAARRATATGAVWLTAGLTVAVIVLATLRFRERPEFQGRATGRPYAAFGDVLRNPHARSLMAVFFLEFLGFATLTTMLPYASAYMLHTEKLTAVYIATTIITASVAIPGVVAATRRWGKKPVWLVSLAVKTLFFCGVFFLGEGAWAALLGMIFFFGVAYGTGLVVGPSAKADVVDYDEWQTGERKEGAYFAAWSLAAKWGIALALLLSGLALDFSGFVPNAEQNAGALMGIRLMTSLFPAVFHLLAFLILWRFRFTESEHRAVRTAIAKRKLGEAGLVAAAD